MSVLNRKYKVSTAQKRPSGMWFSSTGHDQKKMFNNTVKYIVKLRRDGVIDHNRCEGLVRQATASFVEREVSDRLDEVFVDIIPYGRFLNLP